MVTPLPHLAACFPRASVCGGSGERGTPEGNVRLGDTCTLIPCPPHSCLQGQFLRAHRRPGRRGVESKAQEVWKLFACFRPDGREGGLWEEKEQPPGQGRGCSELQGGPRGFGKDGLAVAPWEILMGSQRCGEGRLWVLLGDGGDRLASPALQRTPVSHLRCGDSRSHQPCRGCDGGETRPVVMPWGTDTAALALLCGALNCVPRTALMSQTPGARM